VSVLIALAYCVPDAAAQSSVHRDWNAVVATPRNTSVRVQNRQGRKLAGRLESVTDLMIVISVRGTTTQIGRPNVAKVYRLKRRPLATSAAIGALVGGIAGLVFGLTQGSRIGKGSATAGAVAIIGIGAGAGLVVGAAHTPKMLIYAAP
jgi:hypothetical protein